MILKLRSDIEELSPWIRLLDHYGSQTEDRLINFSLGKARTSAWLVASMINSTPTDDLARELEILDDGVAAFGSPAPHPKQCLIPLHPPPIRLRHTNAIPHIIT